ncbi:MAG: uroporphyrinogen-III synthase [Aridibacter famidurans]|nr:uroporphyrinogen-III synthase [Aridibacter famidurans]
MKNNTIAVLGGDRNTRYAERLRGLGYDIVNIQLVEYRSGVLELGKKHELDHPERFDLLIFADETAVECVGEFVRETSMDPTDFDQTITVALGESVADRLRSLPIHSDVIPAKSDSATAFESISAYLGGEEALNGLTVLLVAAVETSAIPAAELRKAGCLVYTLKFSTLLGIDLSAMNRMKALVIGGGVDQVFFSSTLDVFERGVLKERGFDLFAGGATAVCADELTKAALEESGVESQNIEVLR